MANKKPQKKDSSVMVAIIGAAATIIVAIIGLVSAWIQHEPPVTTDATLAMTETLIPATITPTINLRLIFTDTFDNNKSQWSTGETYRDKFKAYRDRQPQDLK